MRAQKVVHPKGAVARKGRAGGAVVSTVSSPASHKPKLDTQLPTCLRAPGVVCLCLLSAERCNVTSAWKNGNALIA